ncbi:MAG: hemerythrin domain-containing protein [Planctomycetes bacterium]|nr:hemerythrin domain-containing protein [Planctomycetota bacterium]
MATVCRTLAVNAAFLLEIKEDNRQLKDVLRKCKQLLRNPCTQRSDVRQWTDSLSELRDQLAMHFALEDAYGYFEDAVMQAPRLCQRAESLHQQHIGLFLDICRIADSADRLLHHKHAVQQIRHLSDAFFAFVEQFETHEHLEDALIMAAFEDDIGVGD